MTNNDTGTEQGREPSYPSGREFSVIRIASHHDVDDAVAVWNAANPSSPLREHPERLRTWSVEPDARLLVADGDLGVCGMLVSLPGRAIDGIGDPIPGLRHLTGLAVHPDRWREGIGGALLDAAVADARGCGCDRLTLWTAQSNTRAQRLFEAKGFRPTGRSQVDDVGAEMIHHELVLEPVDGGHRTST